MEKLTQKWCIVSFFEEVPRGYEFDKGNRPLHITLADVHAADWKVNPSLMNKLERLANESRSFTAKALKVGFLGPESNHTEVTFVDLNLNLVQLHERLIDLLEDEDAKFNVHEFNRKGFIPHSTIQKHARVEEGEELIIDNLTLIDMFPEGDGNKRKVTKVIMLQS